MPSGSARATSARRRRRRRMKRMANRKKEGTGGSFRKRRVPNFGSAEDATIAIC